MTDALVYVGFFAYITYVYMLGMSGIWKTCMRINTMYHYFFECIGSGGHEVLQQSPFRDTQA